jgi:hypothetical protein
MIERSMKPSKPPTTPTLRYALVFEGPDSVRGVEALRHLLQMATQLPELHCIGVQRLDKDKPGAAASP